MRTTCAIGTGENAIVAPSIATSSTSGDGGSVAHGLTACSRTASASTA
jgi:hypothetical protein